MIRNKKRQKIEKESGTGISRMQDKEMVRTRGEGRKKSRRSSDRQRVRAREIEEEREEG